MHAVNRGRISAMSAPTLSLILAVLFHHSIAGVYDSAHQVTVDGVIAEFHFVNPHPFLLVDVNGERWKMEMDNLSELVEVGMTKFTLKPGDRVLVSGKPARSTPAQSLYIMKLDRPAD